jgi:hypothetical protein
MKALLKNNSLSAAGMQPEIVTLAVPDDDRVWVPQEPSVWFRPLMLNTVSGGWFNLLRVPTSDGSIWVCLEGQLALPGA